MRIKTYGCFRAAELNTVEDIESACRREVREEIDAEIKIKKLALICDKRIAKSQVIICFEATIDEIDFNPDNEAKTIYWFPLDALPENVSSSNRVRIEAFRKSRTGCTLSNEN